MGKLGGKGGTAEAATASLGAGGLAGVSGMGAAIAAGVALSPVLATVGLGLGGLGLAAFGAAKDTKAMSGILGPLKSEVDAFSASLKPEVLTLFGQGAGIASRVLRDLQPVAAQTGKALSGVLGAVDAEFAGKNWQDFFGFMERTAGPDVRLLGSLFTDLAADIPPLVETLQPVAAGLLKITDAAARLPVVLDQVRQKTGAAQPGVFGGTGLDRIREFISWGEKNLPAGNKSLSDLIGLTGRATSAAAGGIHAVAAAAVAAAPKVGTLSGDMALLNMAVQSGNVQMAAFSNLWDLFVGNAVGDQQAVLNVTLAFENYGKTVANSKKTSAQAQQAFLSIFTAMGTGLDTLRKNGASVSQLNGFYATSIARLNALHGLTPQQRADVQGLTKHYLAWANSVAGLSGKVITAAGSIRGAFLVQLGFLHARVPQAKDDANALANSILKTGTDSRSTAGDRARLIADLEKAGLSAIQAKALVVQFQDKINGLKGKTVGVSLAASGSGQIVISGTGISSRFIDTRTGHVGVGHAAAAGWYVTGGIPGVDSVPILAKAGELVVPTGMVSSGEVDHLRGRIPGFDAGGVVGKVAGAEGALGLTQAQWGQLAAAAFATSAVQAAMKAAAAAAPGFTSGPAASGSAAAAQAFARLVLPAGWSWPALLALWNRESGWNANAVNPSSGAYGIPQALGKGHPFNLGDYANQVRWGIGYIAGRYGSSQAAEAHELAFNWYGNGLDAVFTRPTVIGVGDAPGGERVTVTPAGRGGGDSYVYNISVHADATTDGAQIGRAIVERIRQHEHRNGKGWRT